MSQIQHHIYVIAEGCLDIVLASQILSRVSRDDVKPYLVIRRGWRDSIDHAINLAQQNIKSLVFIDFNSLSNNKFNEILNLYNINIINKFYFFKF